MKVSKKKVMKKAKKAVARMGKDFSKSPLARAARGKHTKGFI